MSTHSTGSSESEASSCQLTDHHHGSQIAMTIAALGVVFGDIGTSPLYAIKECFHGIHAIEITSGNILGVMSLVFWSLLMMVSVKYLTFIMRADNNGEGGIFALAAMIIAGHRRQGRSVKSVAFLTIMAVFGASLLYGDGIITPAISVLSAVEGLNVATSAAEPLIIPLTCLILLLLFMVQNQGTGRIGRVFGVIMTVWFTSLAALGAWWVAKNPAILAALNPAYAISFFAQNGLHGFVVLGSVVMCITGGEALYADMGHFGARPIRISWYSLVFPALVCNYAGQCALLLDHPELAASPFFSMVPEVLLYPMVALSTLATVIASQAMITGVFSLTHQAVQLGFFPRVRIVHTSGDTKGQIYVPLINTLMMLGCIALVLSFKSSSGLAGAYGIAVTSTMAITTILYAYVTRTLWHWPLWKTVVLGCGLFFFDFAYLGANLLKIFDGGWLTLMLAGLMALVMITWRDGRAVLGKRISDAMIPVEVLLKDLNVDPPHRTPGTGIFLAVSKAGTPLTLVHHLRHNQTLPEQVVLLTISSSDLPYISPCDRLEIQHLGLNFYRLVAEYGFMETPSVPDIFQLAADKGLNLDMYDSWFFTGRETLLNTGSAPMARWRKTLFAFLSRNAWNASPYFSIPAERVVELGRQVEL